MAETNLEKELEEEFGTFGFYIAGNIPILEKLSDLCNNYGINCGTILAEWLSFSKGNNNMPLTDEVLIEFEKKKLHASNKNARKSNTPHRPNTFNINTIAANISAVDEDGDGEDNIYGGYATPQGKENIKRLKDTPGNNHNKRIAGSTSTIGGTTSSKNPLTPAALSTTTPLSKYDSRDSKDHVVTCYGISEQTKIDWKGCNKSVNIRAYSDECNVNKAYKHMFQKLQDKADVLNEMITKLSSQMKAAFMLDPIESLATKSQDNINIAGRVCCDSVGRINSKSVVIEGSKETSAGQRIPLDLSDVKNYSLFPGQIVAIQGRNMSGLKIFPTSIYTGTGLPFYCASKKGAMINEDNFTVYIACGPYATCDDKKLSYAPFEDLLKIVKQEKPNVLIMLGPFVDCKQPPIENGDVECEFENYFKDVKNAIDSCVDKNLTKTVLIPSQRDVFHHPIYPQPPFDSDEKSDISMFSDPCTLMINDVCFGITSTDILFHLGAEEISSVRSDRLGRLAGHLLQQQCYYPLHPPSEDVNLDYERFENHGFMPVTPDVLIVPSELRYFVKNVADCLCINPGRLTKGETGGTYAKLLVKPKRPVNANKSTVVDHSIAQIVRI